MMFIGREREMDALNKMYASGKFEFAVIYGRRRVGKTALINQFISDKRAIYFVGIESNQKQNLENFSMAVLEYQIGSVAGASFPTFQNALEHVFKLSERERIILVIDEYPYVARTDSSLASVMQRLIDQYKETSKMMLILCGSSISYMEDHVLSYKAPLYGRRTAQLKIQPFDFFDSCRYLAPFSKEDKAFIYGMTGGTPQYLLQINTEKSLEENIKDLFLNPVSAMFEEPENLLKQEVREPALYNAIITAVASGATRMSEISSKVGESTNVCASYLKNLTELEIIRRETPYGEKNSRRSVYVISDNMFRFWYRFVPDNISLIARGAAQTAYLRMKPHFSDYMGRIYEEICRQYLWKLLLEGESPVLFRDLGRWWGTDPGTRSQTEIDIMGEQDKHTAIFGECKWTNEKIDTGVLETLRSRSRLFQYERVSLFLFSKSGFTQGCTALAGELGNVTLVTYKEIFAD